MSVFSRLGYNFDSDKFGDAGLLSASTQNILNLSSNNSTFYDWQAVDLAAGPFNKTQYYRNPTSNVCSQLSSNLISLYTISNTLGTPVLPGMYTPITNTAAALADTTLNCIIELSRFVSHTNNISGYSSNTSTATVPTYDSVLAIGNQLVMILNKTDGISNSVGVMGALTSLFVNDQITSNNTIINSDYVSISTAGASSTISMLNDASSHVSNVTSLLSGRRNSDWSFYQNAVQVVKDYSQLTRFSNISDTQTFMINNYIGSPTLINNITNTTTTPVSYSSQQLIPINSPSNSGSAIGLSQTGVIPGSYVAPLMTVDSFGRITSSANSTISVDSTGANTSISGNVKISGDISSNNISSNKLDITKLINGDAFVINATGGVIPNFTVQGAGEQSFRLYNSDVSPNSTRTSVKLASRLNSNWEWIVYTDNSGTGVNDLTIQNLTGTAVYISNNRSVSIGTTTQSNVAGSLLVSGTINGGFPGWTLYMDTTSGARTSTSPFTQSVRGFVQSMGDIPYQNIISTQSLWYRMKIYSPGTQVVTQYNYQDDDNIYYFISGGTGSSTVSPASHLGSGSNKGTITWTLTAGINTLDIVQNNLGGGSGSIQIIGDFFYRYPNLQFVYP